MSYSWQGVSTEDLVSLDGRFQKLLELPIKPDRELILDPFTALVNNIVFQQISYKAGLTIWNRFMTTFESLSPELIRDRDEDYIQALGLSYRKAGYIKDLAKTFCEHPYYTRAYFQSLEEDALRRTILQCKGLGPWSLDMFKLFCLGDPHVLSFGDLGIRRGLAWVLEIEGELTKKEYDYIYRKIKPAASLASILLWTGLAQGYIR